MALAVVAICEQCGRRTESPQLDAETLKDQEAVDLILACVEGELGARGRCGACRAGARAAGN